MGYIHALKILPGDLIESKPPFSIFKIGNLEGVLISSLIRKQMGW